MNPVSLSSTPISSVQRGFTLLELLIAMTLMGIMLVLLFGGLRLGARSWEAAVTQADKNEHMRLVQQFMRRQLSYVESAHWLVDGVQQLAFEGQSQRLQFVAPLAAWSGQGGLYVLIFEVAEDSLGGKSLLLQRAFFQSDMEEALEDEDKIEETLLLEQVNDVHFTYFGSERLNEAPEWHERWEAQRELPWLVRVEFDLEEGDWPDLVILLRQAHYQRRINTR